ncbi:Rne/Rng family ribonuclease [Clostridium sp. B9]|uniref:Rne/Rng family ribonuclease n=1 Tax=Clostridium sp. B9 TaxID=3423224 RepID=UPI003D2EB12E
MRDIFVERRENLLRVAIKENNLLSECYIEEESLEPIPGEIYKGIVKRIVPGIKSAFIDIGHSKQAYMVLGDDDKELKQGDEIIVEVIKEQLGNKGAKVTSKISLAGRYCVLETSKNDISISRKIENLEFKKELENSLFKTSDIGVTVRTKAQLATIGEIQNEIEELYRGYKEILREGKFSLNPKRLFGKGDLINKLIIDDIDSETSTIFVDSLADYERIKDSMANAEYIKVVLYDEVRNLFDYYGIEKDILSLRNNRVNLSCGGDIVIEKTEAMHVIDVNSGRNTNHRNREKTAYETNKNAAIEIARQIKIRNLGGIILVDFIDMYSENNKKKILDILRNEFKTDRQRAKVLPFTELGLVQITRYRKGKSIYDYIEENCPLCNGHGKRLKLSYINLLLKNEILKKNGEGKIKDFHLEINSMYEDDIRGNIFEFLKEIGALDLNIYLNFEETKDFYKVEPLIFKNQIDSVSEYLVKNIEKY